MNKAKAKQIAAKWMFPTEKSSYMGGLEDRPVLVKSAGSIVTDINGKEYLDFQSGQMGAALGHQHPRMVKVIEKAMKQIVTAGRATGSTANDNNIEHWIDVGGRFFLCNYQGYIGSGLQGLRSKVNASVS